MRQITIGLQGKIDHVYRFTFDKSDPSIGDISKKLQDLSSGIIPSVCISIDNGKTDGAYDVIFTQEIVKECIVITTEKIIK